MESDFFYSKYSIGNNEKGREVEKKVLAGRKVAFVVVNEAEE